MILENRVSKVMNTHDIDFLRHEAIRNGRKIKFFRSDKIYLLLGLVMFSLLILAGTSTSAYFEQRNAFNEAALKNSELIMRDKLMVKQITQLKAEREKITKSNIIQLEEVTGSIRKPCALK